MTPQSARRRPRTGLGDRDVSLGIAMASCYSEGRGSLGMKPDQSKARANRPESPRASRTSGKCVPRLFSYRHFPFCLTQ